MPTKEESRERIVNLVREEAARGNAVISTMEGLKIINVHDLIQQSTQGILYDLNRSPEIVLTFIDDPKWVNDYAVGLVITKLKEELDLARK